MNTLKAQKRDMTTKAKRLRREGYVTGNLYGKKLEASIPVKITQKEAEKVLKDCIKGTQILLDVDGEVYDVLIKEMDYDINSRRLLEIDFQALVSNEKVHSVAEIILYNKEKVVEGVLEQLLTEVSYRAYPSELVDRIEVDAGNLRLGDHIRVADLEFAKNEKVDILTNPESIIASVLAVRGEAKDDDTEEKTEE